MLLFLQIATFAVALAAVDQSPAPSPENHIPNASCRAGGDRLPLAPRAMFDYINLQRDRFAKHAPYSGYPWRGAYTQWMTWPLRMNWSDDLARKAQAEAERLAAGEPPAGRRFRHQFAGLYEDRVEDLWLRGLEGPHYEIAGRSKPDTEPDNAWHAANNGTMRLAVLYQTGESGNPAKTRLGIGKACAPDGGAWWVLLLGE